jgi:hypothetical protein
MMFMHISPEASMYGESVSTLNFAKRVAEVTLGQVGWVRWGRGRSSLGAARPVRWAQG